MAGKKEEELNVQVIPENFVDTGRCFNGMFRTRNLIEGVALSAIPAYISLNSSLDWQNKIIVTVVLVGVIMALTLSGINGYSFLEFISSWASYNKRKRVAKYNPRVKAEAKPGYLTEEEKELPRDKILRIFNEIRKRETTEGEAVSRDIYDPAYKEFFEDDLGILETPDDLKTKQERKRAARELKKEREKAKAEAKRLAKVRAKEERQRAKEEIRSLNKSARETKAEIKKERARLKKAEKQLRKNKKKGGDHLDGTAE